MGPYWLIWRDSDELACFKAQLENGGAEFWLEEKPRSDCHRVVWALVPPVFGFDLLHSGINNMINGFGVKSLHISPTKSNTSFHEIRQASIKIQGLSLGSLSRTYYLYSHPQINIYLIKQPLMQMHC
jgi:hypothetical protein